MLQVLIKNPLLLADILLPGINPTSASQEPTLADILPDFKSYGIRPPSPMAPGADDPIPTSRRYLEYNPILEGILCDREYFARKKNFESLEEKIWFNEVFP